MLTLTTKLLNQLLKLIKNPEEKKIVKKFLREVMKTGLEKSMKSRSDILKTRSAKKALDMICRIGLQLGEHALIESFFHLFD